VVLTWYDNRPTPPHDARLLLTTRPLAPMSADPPRQGMLGTNIMILRKWIDPGQLPDEMAISAITLAELSAGPHEVRRCWRVTRSLDKRGQP
jgi:hypothetical protein